MSDDHFRLADYLTPNGRRRMYMRNNPDKPRPWDPDHPTLRMAPVAHESAALLRMQRAGWTGLQMMEVLRLSQDALKRQFRRGLDLEGMASRDGRLVYDTPIKRGTV